MIPHVQLELDATIPESYGYWTPRNDDLSEEGFGFFRGTWLIRGVTLRAAGDVLNEEATLLQLAVDVAADADEFDQLAKVLEEADAEGLSDRLATPAVLAAVGRYANDFPPLGGLDLGVAGLVHALSAVGCWPAASCRSHPGDRAWTHRPAVFLAADRHRAHVLQRLVGEAGCGFGLDPSRENLLLIEAESIEDMINLANLVLRDRRAFVPAKPARRTRPSVTATVEQGALDID